MHPEELRKTQKMESAQLFRRFKDKNSVDDEHKQTAHIKLLPFIINKYKYNFKK